MHPRKIDRTVAFGSVIAILTVIGLGLYGWLFASAMIREPSKQHLIILLYNWQSQVAAIFAVAAALLGATAVIYQTGQARRADEDRRLRRALALRASLPMLLDALVQYLIDCAGAYNEVWNIASGALTRDPAVEFPSLLEGIAEGLSSYVEAVGYSVAGPQITLLLKQLQIYRARVRDTVRRSKTGTTAVLSRVNIMPRLVDTAELYSRCDKLFIFARSRDELAVEPVTTDDVVMALNMLPLNDISMTDLRAELDKRTRFAINNGQVWPER